MQWQPENSGIVRRLLDSSYDYIVREKETCRLPQFFRFSLYGTVYQTLLKRGKDDTTSLCSSDSSGFSEINNSDSDKHVVYRHLRYLEI